MAKSSIKLRAKEKNGTVTVKALMTHAMETGQRKDKKTGGKIPAHYIKDIAVTANGNTVMNVNWTASVSKNPYLSFDYKGAKGDKVSLAWKDNKDGSDSLETTVK